MQVVLGASVKTLHEAEPGEEKGGARGGLGSDKWGPVNDVTL